MLFCAAFISRRGARWCICAGMCPNLEGRLKVLKFLFRKLFGDDQKHPLLWGKKKERFTSCSRSVLRNAQQEAERLHQLYIEPQQLLIGIMREERSTAFDILQKSGLTISIVESKIPTLAYPNSVQVVLLGLSTEVKKLLEFSVDEA